MHYRPQVEILSYAASATKYEKLTLEVALDTRDILGRIADALEAAHGPSPSHKPVRKNAWANKEKIMCSLCFKKYKNIKLHVLRRHQMTFDEAQKITTKE